MTTLRTDALWGCRKVVGSDTISIEKPWRGSSERSISWRDAQLLSMVIGRRALQRLARPAAAATEGSAAATDMTLVPHISAGEVAVTRAAGLPEAARQNHDGRVPDHLSDTRLLRSWPSRQCARLLRLKRRPSRIFEIAFSAMPGMIGRELPNNFTIFLSRLASESGSVRKTSGLVCR